MEEINIAEQPAPKWHQKGFVTVDYALLFAYEDEDVDVFKEVIEDEILKDNNEETIFHIMNKYEDSRQFALYYACYHHRTNLVDMIKEYAYDKVFKLDNLGTYFEIMNSGLSGAATAGHLDLIDMLTKDLYGPNDYSDALAFACSEGHLDIFNLLLERYEEGHISNKGLGEMKKLRIGLSLFALADFVNDKNPIYDAKLTMLKTLLNDGAQFYLHPPDMPDKKYRVRWAFKDMFELCNGPHIHKFNYLLIRTSLSYFYPEEWSEYKAKIKTAIDLMFNDDICKIIDKYLNDRVRDYIRDHIRDHVTGAN
jgi:hypothetical protein